jgi:hypothetical protein
MSRRHIKGKMGSPDAYEQRTNEKSAEPETPQRVPLGTTPPRLWRLREKYLQFRNQPKQLSCTTEAQSHRGKAMKIQAWGLRLGEWRDFF